MDRTQTSELIRYALIQLNWASNKVKMFIQRDFLFSCEVFRDLVFFESANYVLFCRTLKDIFPLLDLGHLKRVRCLKNGKGSLRGNWVINYTQSKSKFLLSLCSLPEKKSILYIGITKPFYGTRMNNAPVRNNWWFKTSKRNLHLKISHH